MMPCVLATLPLEGGGCDVSEGTKDQWSLRDQSLRALFVGMVLYVLATLLLEGGGCDVSESQLFNLCVSYSLMLCMLASAEKWTSEQDQRSKG